MLTARIVDTAESGLAGEDVSPREFPYVVVLYDDNGQMIDWDVARSFEQAVARKSAMLATAE